MSYEIIRNTKEIEQNIPLEIERKFLPVFPERLAYLREESRPIEQVYLSHPSEPFNLRLRECFDETGAPLYVATLKDGGSSTAQGLERIEIEARVSPACYRAYKDMDLPLVRKLRAEPRPGIVVDFYEDGAIRIESEDNGSWQYFSTEHDNQFVEATSDLQMNNEWLAHLNFRQTHGGDEAIPPMEELRADEIVRDIRNHLLNRPQAVVHIGGRSGSGKSTVVSKVQTHLRTYGLESIVFSTDDYHRGTRWLSEYNAGEPWVDWDSPIVYDTQAMAADIARLKNGQAVYGRTIDWSVAEPVITREINPAPVIIIEGIYALSQDIVTDGCLSYEMTTPLATCVGRRLLRDLRERPEFADPAKSLAYMLEYAEPAYQAQLRART